MKLIIPEFIRNGYEESKEDDDIDSEIQLNTLLSVKFMNNCFNLMDRKLILLEGKYYIFGSNLWSC